VQRRHNCSPAASFVNCVMTLYLLKVHLQTFLSIPITQKLPNFELWHSCRKWAICPHGAILRTNFVLTRRRKIPKDSYVWFIHSLYYVLMTDRVESGYNKFSLFIQDTNSSQTQQLYYTITFKANIFQLYWVIIRPSEDQIQCINIYSAFWDHKSLQ